MILEEFVHIEKKKLNSAFEKLNEKKVLNGDSDPGDGSFIMEADCKCPYGDVDPSDCEDLCRLNHK